MIKEPIRVRDRVLSEIRYMVHHMCLMMKQYHDSEMDVMLALEHPRSEELVLELTGCVMDKFGPALRRPNHTAVNTEPRFDKARRALAKKTPKGPRGVPRQKIDPIEQETV